jgi:lysozyme
MDLSFAIDLIKKFEGLELKAYQDVAKVWTIGYGATGPGIGPGLTWTQQQADADLARRVGLLDAQLEHLLRRAPRDHQRAALLSLMYNIGAAALSGSSALRDFNAGNDQAAADDFLKWKYVTVGGEKVVDEGLLKRRRQERAVFLSDASAAGA